MEGMTMAEFVASQLGVTSQELEGVLMQVQDANRMALIGGYNIDIAIAAIYGVLRNETDHAGNPVVTHGDNIKRINKCLDVIYAGLI